MGLERFVTPGITSIEDLRPCEKITANALEHYRYLQKTALFDADREVWFPYMHRDLSRLSYNDSLSAGDQLLGVYAEALFDKKNALRIYKNLQNTWIYNKDPAEWRSYMLDNLQEGSWAYLSSDQLLGVLVEGIFDKPKAEEIFTRLTGTVLYSNKRQEWCRGLQFNLSFDKEYPSEPQLVHILIEAMTDKKTAFDHYEALKKTRLYDNRRTQWVEYVKEDTHMKGVFFPSDFRHSKDQLLGILIESFFDKERAAAMYNSLKKTKLFDAETKLWNWYMRPDQTINDDAVINTTEQLFDVIVQNTLEQSELLSLNDTPVPVVRRF